MGLFQKYIDCLETQIHELTTDIQKRIAPHQEVVDKLRTIPRVSQTTIEVILAEICLDISAFQSEKYLASWVGLCPGSYESSGSGEIRKSAHITKGNKYFITLDERWDSPEVLNFRNSFTE